MGVKSSYSWLFSKRWARLKDTWRRVEQPGSYAARSNAWESLPEYNHWVKVMPLFIPSMLLYPLIVL